MRYKLTNYICLFIVILAVIIFHKFITREHVYLSARDTNGYLAQVIWENNFPYVSISSYLIVRNENYEIICKKILLQNRDHYSDVLLEMIGIEWIDKENIKLEINRNFYTGKDILNMSECVKKNQEKKK